MAREKKRKLEALVDPDAERTLHGSFVTAANSISQLYTQSVAQQRKASATASRQTLERVLEFVLRESPSSDAVPKAALLSFLHQEYESLQGCENMPHQFPVQIFPNMQQGATAQPTDDMDRGRNGQAAGIQSPSIRRGAQHGSAAWHGQQHGAQQGQQHGAQHGGSAMDATEHHGMDAALPQAFAQQQSSFGFNTFQ